MGTYSPAFIGLIVLDYMRHMLAASSIAILERISVSGDWRSLASDLQSSWVIEARWLRRRDGAKQRGSLRAPTHRIESSQLLLPIGEERPEITLGPMWITVKIVLCLWRAMLATFYVGFLHISCSGMLRHT